MTINYYCLGKKLEFVKIHVRVSAGRGMDYRAFTGLFVDTKKWDNATQTFVAGVELTRADQNVIDSLWVLKRTIFNRYRALRDKHITEQWLEGIVEEVLNTADRNVYA